MRHYRNASDTTYDCKYHIVWITKYRKQILTGLVSSRVRELLLGIRKEHEVEILKGQIPSDQVRLFLSVPPHLLISKLFEYLKGKSSYKMLQENQQLSQMFWGRPLWGGGYFVATSGNITDADIKEYIRTQDDDEHDDDFSIG